MAYGEIRKGDEGYEKLVQKWKADKKKPGWLADGSRHYRVIEHEDGQFVFVPVAGNIDSMYGSMSGGI